jgi:uncharacterized membrane protein
MLIFEMALIAAAFLCSLVAGLLFIFAVVVMPGIGRLSDRGYVRAFQVMDGIIQDNQPLFVIVWVGSVISLLVAAVLGIGSLLDTEAGDTARGILLVVSVAYLLGVQGPTVAINIPLNNRLQQLDTETMDEDTLRAARAAFEPRWNRSNQMRAAVASVSAAMLIVAVASV